MERLKTSDRKVVGSKETTKRLERSQVKVVYVAMDAQERVITPVLRLAEERGVEIVRVPSMAELGQAAGIKVGAATAAILTDTAV